MTATATLRELTQWEVDLLARHRLVCADSPAALADIDQTEADWRSLPAPGPCPSWCTIGVGHGYVDEGDPSGAEFGRYHSAGFGVKDLDGCTFHVSVFEQVDRDGTVTTHKPDVLLPEQATINDPLLLIDFANAALDASQLLRKIIEGEV